MTAETPPQTWVEYAEVLGHRIAQARHAKGLTQEQVAQAAGISTFTYQKLEKGESNPGSPANPGLQTLVALAVALQVDLCDLLPDPPSDLDTAA